MNSAPRFFIFALAAVVVGGVKHGDEKFAHISATDGNFFAFCNGPDGGSPSIDVVGLKDGTWQLLKSLPVDKGSGWSDPVYIESCKGTGNERPAYVMVGDRNHDEIYVVNPFDLKVEQKVTMSDRPVHTYAVAKTGEFWAHADGDGFFDVINIDHRVDALFREDIRAKVGDGSHGKLLFDEGLWPYGYASTTGESYVIQINMVTHQTTGHFNFTNYNASHPWHCPGTHGLAFSTKNGHIYATCSRVGLIELNPHGNTMDVVTKHPGATGGQVYATPDESHILTLDKGNGYVHLLKPQGRGAHSSKEYPSIIAKGLGPNQAGAPDKPVFTQNTDGSWRLFVSLTVDNEGGSGLAWIDLKTVEANPNQAQTMNFIAAGSVKAGGRYTYRSIATGGGYVATITDLPSAGLSIVDSAGGAATTVTTNEGLSRVHWVPRCWQGLYCGEIERKCTVAAGDTTPPTPTTTTTTTKKESADLASHAIPTVMVMLVAMMMY